MKKNKDIKDTLFIPLTGRAYVSKRFPDFFYDEKSVSISDELSDFIVEDQNEFSMFASCIRYIRSDMEIKKFLKENKLSNIIFLGAGLETAYHRIKDKKNRFYEVDLEEVIAVREKIIGSASNDTLVAGDMFDLNWLESIDTSLPTMIVGNGIFHYFKKEVMIEFFTALQKRFSGSLHIVFDIVNESGLKAANKYVKKTGNDNALMHFYINDSKEFIEKLEHAILLAEYPFFSGIIDPIKTKLTLKTRIFMVVTDKLKRLKILHIKFK